MKFPNILGYFSKTIRHYGGLWRYIKALNLRDSAKPGRLVGTDKYGNRYYENNDYFFLRNRWVEYADHVGYNYDGSQVPAEWFGWIHHRTDLTPDQEPYRPKYHWILPHEENMTGTPLQYVPYTTTRPRIQPWAPPPPRGDQLGRPPSDQGDSSGDCGDGKALPAECKEEESTTATEGEEETQQESESEEKKHECDEKPKCEKPGKVFH